jgi:glycosyltransferase involved in cell wall biosynthesis
VFAATLPPFAYSDPWREPLADRVAAFRRGDLRVAYFYERPDTSTFRYRAHNMVRELNRLGGGISAAWFSHDDGDVGAREAATADVLVVARVRYDSRVNRLISMARGRGARILFDVDDLVFDLRYAHLLISSLDQDPTQDSVWDTYFAYIGRFSQTLRLAEGCITTNTLLARRLHDCVGLPVWVVPNFLSEEQIEASDRIWDAKHRSGFARTRELHIGYFSGTPTHNRDFAVAAPAVAALMDRNPHIRLRLVGFLDASSHLARHADRIERHPLQDFLNLQRLIGEVELNIAPLQDNIFTNCKSQLKFFEAAVVGTATVASPTFTFRESIQDGENAWLARAWEWGEKMESAIARLDDDYPRFAEQARERALAEFAPGRFGQVIADIVTQAAPPVIGAGPDEVSPSAARSGS